MKNQEFKIADRIVSTVNNHAQKVGEHGIVNSFSITGLIYIYWLKGNYCYITPSEARHLTPLDELL